MKNLDRYWLHEGIATAPSWLLAATNEPQPTDTNPEPSPTISAVQQPLSVDTEPELIARISVKGGTLDGKVVEVKGHRVDETESHHYESAQTKESDT